MNNNKYESVPLVAQNEGKSKTLKPSIVKASLIGVGLMGAGAFALQSFNSAASFQSLRPGLAAPKLGAVTENLQRIVLKTSCSNVPFTFKGPGTVGASVVSKSMSNDFYFNSSRAMHETSCGVYEVEVSLKVGEEFGFYLHEVGDATDEGTRADIGCTNPTTGTGKCPALESPAPLSGSTCTKRFKFGEDEFNNRVYDGTTNTFEWGLCEVDTCAKTEPEGCSVAKLIKSGMLYDWDAVHSKRNGSAVYDTIGQTQGTFTGSAKFDESDETFSFTGLTAPGWISIDGIDLRKTDFSIEAWVNFPERSLDDMGSIIGQGIPTQHRWLALKTYGQETCSTKTKYCYDIPSVIRFGAYGNGVFNKNPDDFDVTEGSWQHIIAFYSQNTNRPEALFVNGTKITSLKRSGSVGKLKSTGNFRIGAQGSGPSDCDPSKYGKCGAGFFDGKMKAVRIYDRELSDEEAANNFEYGMSEYY